MCVCVCVCVCLCVSVCVGSSHAYVCTACEAAFRQCCKFCPHCVDQTFSLCVGVCGRLYTGHVLFTNEEEEGGEFEIRKKDAIIHRLDGTV